MEMLSLMMHGNLFKSAEKWLRVKTHELAAEREEDDENIVEHNCNCVWEQVTLTGLAYIFFFSLSPSILLKMCKVKSLSHFVIYLLLNLLNCSLL